MELNTRFVLELILVCGCVYLGWGQSCPPHRQASAKLTVNSQRNQTGHWISQVRIEHGDDTVASSPWTAEVEHNKESCNGVESVELAVTLTAPPLRAGPGYELHRGVGYYKVHSQTNTWHEARRICAEEGGHLAIINSDEEAKVLQSIYAPVADGLKDAWAFIGFHDLYSEGQYVTIFDEPLNSTGYYRWFENQPDNAGASATHPGEDCGSMLRNGLLNDLNCDWKAHFICEQELW